jgi:peptide/nickel transport system permease protein
VVGNALRRLATLAAVVVLAYGLTWVALGSLYGSIYGHVTVWHQLGSLPHQLVRAFGHLDLGYDDVYQQPAGESLRQGLPIDGALMLGGLVVGTTLGVLLGLVGGPRPKSAVDSALLVGSSLVISAPVYLVAFVVVAEFSPGTGDHGIGFLSSPGDYTAITRDPLRWLQAMWVPWVIIGAPLAAVTYRMTRSLLRDELEADHLRTARAKGLRERVVMRRHALRAVLPGVLNVVTVMVPTVVANTVLLETAMELPGMFRRLDVSPQTGDNFQTPEFSVIQAMVLDGALLIAVGLFLCEVLHARLDPKMRAG